MEQKQVFAKKVTVILSFFTVQEQVENMSLPELHQKSVLKLTADMNFLKRMLPVIFRQNFRV